MLRLEGVDVHYGRRKALSGISMELREGEFVTLVGANGAGKSTLLRTISGLLTPSAGTIALDGEPIGGRAPHSLVARGLAHVPEARQIFPDMTVRDHLELGAVRARDRHGTFAQRLERVFALFPRLRERSGQRAGTLSGGEQQMVAIGRGLMSAPRLLMLDEPSLGLAPIVVDALADVVAELHREGLTILLVEQRVDLALRLADRGYVMETGRIVLADTAGALLTNPEVKQAFLGL
ncbi:MAG: ABC transporter ATP-binding protein [Rhodospirillales bacterium]|jgi:branched-chain amino acid transport system ATP-binding protein